MKDTTKLALTFLGLALMLPIVARCTEVKPSVPETHPIRYIKPIVQPSALACRVWKLSAPPRCGSAWPLCKLSQDRWIFMTAGHCVRDEQAPPEFVMSSRGRILRVLTSTYALSSDCGILLVEGDGHPVDCLELADREPEDGEPVWLGSWPECEALYVTSGYVTPGEHCFVSSPAVPGSSGGAVLDADGRVLGILTMVYFDLQGPFPGNSSMPRDHVAHMAIMQPTVSFRDFVASTIVTFLTR